MRFRPACGVVLASVLLAALLHAQSGGDTPPSVIIRNDPEYSAEATRARVQSMVLLSIIVGEDGKAHDVKVSQGAGFGLDEKAIEAIETWVFKPGTRDGHPAALPANVEMNFHLQVRGGTVDHSGQFARLNFPLPPGVLRPELRVGELPGNPVATGDQALRFRLQVDIDGVPKNITLLGSTDKVWEQQALRVIRTWRFRPASVDGAAVTADGIFELAHSAPPEPEPMIMDEPGSERAPGAPHVAAPIPISGFIARGNHTATLLANGTVLLAGGSIPGAAPHETASGQVFDPVTRTIANTGNLLTARQGHTATLLKDGTVLIAGGSVGVRAGAGTLGSAEIFDPSTGKFSATGSMHDARSSHAAALLPDGRVLIVGGTGMGGMGSNGKVLASAEIYDPRVKAFVPAAAMATPGTSFSAVTLKDGRILLAGGAGDTAEVFNPESGAFAATGHMTTTRDGLSATLLDNGQVLIAGAGSAEIFDPVSNTFHATAELPGTCDQCVGVRLSSGKVLISGDSPQTEVYDANSGALRPGPLLADMHGAHTATLLEDGNVLVAGSSAEILMLN